MEKELPVKTMSKSELAAHYGVSVKTLNKWLKPIAGKLGKKTGRFYTPKQVAVIKEFLG